MRKTAQAAGYDFMVAEDIVVPSYYHLMDNLRCQTTGFYIKDLADMALMTKRSEAKPTLVPTGVKCYLEPDTYLELSVRSSCPLKHWLILANGVGIIDADYADNEDNEGHIYFQIINLSPFPILLKKGDVLGQGIIHSFKVVDDEAEITTKRSGGFGSTSE